jgi:hypothetical protein
MGDTKQILVVAISTVGGPALGEAILERHREGPAHFHVVVPERIPNRGNTWTTAQVEGDARKRLGLMLELLDKMDVDADGGLTELTDAADVVDKEFFDRAYDEIIVAQGAPGLRRLSDKHRVKKLDKELHIPVTQIEPGDEAAPDGDDPDEWAATLQAWADAIERSPESG